MILGPSIASSPGWVRVELAKTAQLALRRGSLETRLVPVHFSAVDPHVQVTYGDFAVCVLLEALQSDTPTLLDHFPRLAKLKGSVEVLPNVRRWISERPQTDY